MRIRWGCIISGVVAAAFVGAGFHFWLWSSSSHAQAEAALTAEPIRLAVDLSKPSHYHGEFQQTFTSSHGQCLRLETDRGFASEEEGKRALQGLVGAAKLRRPGGEVEWEERLTADAFQIRQFWHAERQHETDATAFCPTLGMPIPPRGTYELDLTVTEGAPALADIAQALVGRYELCGIEYVPAEVAKYIAIGCFTVGGIAAMLVGAVVLMHRVPAH